MSWQYSSYMQGFLGNEWSLNDNTGFYSLEATPFFGTYQNVSTDISFPKPYLNSPEAGLQSGGSYNPNHESVNYNFFDYNQQQAQPVKDNLGSFDVDDLLSLFGDSLDNNTQSQQQTHYPQDAVESNNNLWFPTNEFQETFNCLTDDCSGSISSDSYAVNSSTEDCAASISSYSCAVNSSTDNCAVSIWSDSYAGNCSTDDCSLSISSDSYMDSPSSNNSVSSFGETKDAIGKRKASSSIAPIELKRMRKKEQNKLAATRYRLKKKAELENLSKEEKLTMEKNASLRSRRDELRTEVKHLKSIMKDVYLATMAIR